MAAGEEQDLVAEVAWVAREARELVNDPAAAADPARRLTYHERKAALLEAIAAQSSDPEAPAIAARARRQADELRLVST